MKLVAIVLLAACGGTQQPRNVDNPSCLDVVEHGYSLASRDLAGEKAIVARREFVRVRPQLVTACDQSNITLEKKRCIMHADSANAADRCDLD